MLNMQKKPTKIESRLLNPLLPILILSILIVLTLLTGCANKKEIYTPESEIYRVKPSVNMPPQQPKLLLKSQQRSEKNNLLIKKHQEKLNSIGLAGKH